MIGGSLPRLQRLGTFILYVAVRDLLLLQCFQAHPAHRHFSIRGRAVCLKDPAGSTDAIAGKHRDTNDAGVQVAEKTLLSVLRRIQRDFRQRRDQWPCDGGAQPGDTGFHRLVTRLPSILHVPCRSAGGACHWPRH